MLCRGEFSLVLASLALSAGLDPRIGSFAAGYVLVLAVLGPVAVSSSARLARLVPRRLVPGQPDRGMKPRDGQYFWQEAGVTRAVKNTGTTPLNLVEVELK